MKKKHVLVLVICLVSVLIVGAIIGGVAYAIWITRTTQEVTMAEDEKTNPSLRFQMFHAMDAMDNLIVFQPYQESIHGRIIKRNHTVLDGEEAYDLFELIEGDYILTSYASGDNPTLYVISGQEEYDPALHGERYYENETTNATELYVGTNGERADHVIVGSEVTWYAYHDTTPYALTYQTNSQGEQELFFNNGEDDVWCGQLVCALDTKVPENSGMTSHRLFYYDEESHIVDKATAEEVEAGENLYIMVYSEYDPTDLTEGGCVETYGELVYSTKTAGGFRLYKSSASSYEYATSEEAELRHLLVYTGDYVTYAVATPEQLDAGVNIYYGTGSYEAATPEQIEARQGLFFSLDGEAFSIATATQIDTGEHLYHLTYAAATEEQIAIGRTIYGGNDTAAYALVGYTGTAVSEVVIPATIHDDMSGKDYNVKRICGSPETGSYSFRGNQIITSILFPETVESIAAVTFGNMTNLRDLYFAGTSTIVVGENAFIGCENLTNIYVMPGITLLDTNGSALTWRSEVFKGCTSMNEKSFKNFENMGNEETEEEEEGEGEGD